MAFPRELRQATPDLPAGRILDLEAISGVASHTQLMGRMVP
jgi:hypothetical protein